MYWEGAVSVLQQYSGIQHVLPEAESENMHNYRYSSYSPFFQASCGGYQTCSSITFRCPRGRYPFQPNAEFQMRRLRSGMWCCCCVKREGGGANYWKRRLDFKFARNTMLRRGTLRQGDQGTRRMRPSNTNMLVNVSSSLVRNVLTFGPFVFRSLSFSRPQRGTVWF